MKIKSIADTVVQANFKKIAPSKYSYNSLKTTKSFILTINNPMCHNMFSCICKEFVKRGVCFHLVALSRILDLNLFHPKFTLAPKPDTFVSKERRGRKKKKKLWLQL